MLEYLWCCDCGRVLEVRNPERGRNVRVTMDLGWLDVCLGVRNVAVSRAFYEGLGFHRVEGEDSEGWAVMVLAESRIGLFDSQFLETGSVTLNFRGGNIGDIVAELASRGLPFEKQPTCNPDGSGSATIFDPDGFRIFFDSAPGETKPRSVAK